MMPNQIELLRKIVDYGNLHSIQCLAVGMPGWEEFQKYVVSEAVRLEISPSEMEEALLNYSSLSSEDQADLGLAMKRKQDG